MLPVIKIENVSKYYRLGLIGGATFSEDFGRWVAMARGKPDPLIKIGQDQTTTRKGGEIWALNDVTLDIHQGEILGIIGRNGAGKSTLLKILSRITAPTSGSIKIKGRVGSLLEVGTGFHPELTGRENTYLNGAILGMTRAEVSKKLDEIVEFAEMHQFMDTPVKRYSSGMTVRLAFAVAAHLDPEILVVDEVLAVGDAAFQKKCLGKMQDVAGEGRTVLFVSHQLNMITDLCTRTVLMSSGKVFADGVPTDIVAQYLQGVDIDKGGEDENIVRTPNNAHLKQVKILGIGDLTQPRHLFRFKEDIVVSISYVVPPREHFVAVTIDNAKGVRIFNTRDTDSKTNPSFHPESQIDAKVIIPGAYFSPGYYTIYVDVDTTAHDRSETHETIEMGFEISEDGFNYKGGRTSLANRPILWPAFEWQKSLENGSE